MKRKEKPPAEKTSSQLHAIAQQRALRELADLYPFKYEVLFLKHKHIVYGSAGREFFLHNTGGQRVKVMIDSQHIAGKEQPPPPEPPEISQTSDDLEYVLELAEAAQAYPMTRPPTNEEVAAVLETVEVDHASVPKVHNDPLEAARTAFG